MEILSAVAIIIAACFLLVVFRGAPYVPTQRAQLQQAFDELYPVSKDDLVIDIGSGDGVVLRAAAERQARAIGYEINPILVIMSYFVNRRYKGLIRTYWCDFWRQQLPQDTTVIYAFAESRDIAKLEKFLQEQAAHREKSFHFISYGFALPHQQPIKQQRALLLYRFEAAKKPSQS